MATEYAIHRLTTTEYDRLVASGGLDGMKVELLDGYLVDVSPQGPEHYFVIQRLQVLLGSLDGRLRIQGPLNAEEGSVPEPDVAISPDPPNLIAHPSTALLTVEVAVSAHREARLKTVKYARANVPRYWIVDWPGRTVIEHTEPTPDGYQHVEELRGDDLLDPCVEGVTPFPVNALWG